MLLDAQRRTSYGSHASVVIVSNVGCASDICRAPESRTPLPQVVRCLAAGRADIGRTRRDGATPLFAAVMEAKTAVVEVLCHVRDSDTKNRNPWQQWCGSNGVAAIA